MVQLRQQRMRTSYSLLCLDSAVGMLAESMVQQSYQSWHRMILQIDSENAIWPTLDKFLMTRGMKLHQHVQNISHEWLRQRWTVEYACRNWVVSKDKLLEMQCIDHNYYLMVLTTRISNSTNDKLQPTSLNHTSRWQRRHMFMMAHWCKLRHMFLVFYQILLWLSPKNTFHHHSHFSHIWHRMVRWINSLC